MLTSAHVVKGAKFIKIRLVTDREILGEVLRRNPRLDVALVKAGEQNMVPLPVNEKELNIGAPVCAIGSPLDKSFSSTFTKGVLSAYRTTEGMTFIQSDVNVLPGQSGCPLVDQKGNAVGICVTGVLLGGAPAGLNFFVPINHALNALNIEMVSPAEVESKRLLAAREIKVTPEKPKTEAEKPPLEKETPKVAAIPKEVTIKRVSLRKKPKGILGEITVNNMLVEYCFFDISRNVIGGFENHFVDNNDGTVTDMATGLMWQKSGSSGSLDNRSAKEYVKRLNRKRFSGHSNWRMPTVEELASLIKKDRRNGVHIDPVFDNNQIRCWTVDQCDPNYNWQSGAWIVSFKQGKVSKAMWSKSATEKSYGHDINDINYVKAVRSIK
jgi:hypothetical protein